MARTSRELRRKRKRSSPVFRMCSREAWRMAWGLEDRWEKLGGGVVRRCFSSAVAPSIVADEDVLILLSRVAKLSVH